MDDRSPRRRSTTKKLVASLAILAGVGSFVSYGVFSSFSDSVTNSSSLTSSTFGLTKGLTIPVTISDLIPGDLVIRCYSVTNTSDQPVQAAVAISKSGETGALGSAIAVNVKEGSGATTASEAGCLTFNATATILGSNTPVDSITSLIASPPTVTDPTNPAATSDWQYRTQTALWGAGETKQFQVRYQLPTSVDKALAGKAVTATLTWFATQVPGVSTK